MFTSQFYLVVACGEIKQVMDTLADICFNRGVHLIVALTTLDLSGPNWTIRLGSPREMPILDAFVDIEKVGLVPFGRSAVVVAQ